MLAAVTPSHPDLGAHMDALARARESIATRATRARSVLESAEALVQVRAAQLASSLVPSAEDAILDGLARALDRIELSADAYEEKVVKRRQELAAAARDVPPAADLAALETRLEAAQLEIAALRATLLQVDGDEDLQALRLENQRSSLAGALLSKLRRRGHEERVQKKHGAPVDEVLRSAAVRREQLASLEEEERRVTDAIAAHQRRVALAKEARVALDRVHDDALASVRTFVAELLTTTGADVMRRLLGGDAMRGGQELLLARAKVRYLTAIVDRLLRKPWEDLDDALAKARLFDEVLDEARSGADEAGVEIPPVEALRQKELELVGQAIAAAHRFDRLLPRLAPYTLPDAWAIPDEEPCWWDVIFHGEENGDFVDEVRHHHATRGRGRGATERAAEPPRAPPPLDTGVRHTDPTGAWRRPPPPAPLTNASAAPDDTVTDWLVTVEAERTSEEGGLGPGVVPDLAGLGRRSSSQTRALPFGAPPTAPPVARPTGTGTGHVITPSSVRAAIRQLGPFTLLRPIGQGGMAEVYHAQRQRNGKVEDVVVKLLLPSYADLPRFVAMFEREARLGMQLRHPNIVRIEDLYVIEDMRLLVMELLEGLSTNRLCHHLWRAHKPLPWRLACLLVHDAAAGLAHAHATSTGDGDGVIHRDVSPDNIFATLSGKGVVLDFGIARGLDEETLTRTGELKGKIPFMAPETYEGAKQTSAVDIFALGVGLYWYLTRERPFTGATDAAVIHAILATTPVPPRALLVGSDLPPAIEKLILAMLAKKPKDRPTAPEIVASLSPLVEGVRPVLAGLVAKATSEVSAPAAP
jgi:hypothetical protein